MGLHVLFFWHLDVVGVLEYQLRHGGCKVPEKAMGETQTMISIWGLECVGGNGGYAVLRSGSTGYIYSG
jgi:hypothetical protein